MQHIICPKPECGIAIERVVPTVYFPDDIQGTLALLADSLHYVRCPVCKTLVEGLESYYFSFDPAKFVAAWVPLTLLDKAKAQAEAQLAEAQLGTGFDIFISADRKEVRNKVVECLGNYCLPLLMDYLTVAQVGGQQVWTWAAKNSHEMDRAWIATLGVLAKSQADGVIWLVLPGADEALSNGVLQECLDRIGSTYKEMLSLVMSYRAVLEQVS